MVSHAALSVTAIALVKCANQFLVIALNPDTVGDVASLRCVVSYNRMTLADFFRKVGGVTANC